MGCFCATLQEVFECPAGHYCADGSIEPIQCPSGTYSLISLATSADSCEKCPAGYVCSAGTVDFSQWPCPIGYYCPEGSATALPCAAGTYGSTSQATSADDCQDCPKGKSLICNTTNVGGSDLFCLPFILSHESESTLSLDIMGR